MGSNGNGDAVEAVERAILQIGWLGQRQLMQLLADERFELTIPQFHTLAHLTHCKTPCKMSDLAKATHQSAASLTGVVDRLLEKQLVARTRQDSDRRQVMVVCSERGRVLLAAIKQARHEEMQAALREMDESEAHELLRLLRVLLDSMARRVEVQAQHDA